MQYIGEDATLSYFLRLGYVLGIGFVLMPYFLRLVYCSSFWMISNMSSVVRLLSFMT